MKYNRVCRSVAASTRGLSSRRPAEPCVPVCPGSRGRRHRWVLHAVATVSWGPVTWRTRRPWALRRRGAHIGGGRIFDLVDRGWVRRCVPVRAADDSVKRRVNLWVGCGSRSVSDCAVARPGWLSRPRSDSGCSPLPRRGGRGSRSELQRLFPAEAHRDSIAIRAVAPADLGTLRVGGTASRKRTRCGCARGTIPCGRRRCGGRKVRTRDCSGRSVAVFASSRPAADVRLTAAPLPRRPAEVSGRVGRALVPLTRRIGRGDSVGITLCEDPVEDAARMRATACRRCRAPPSVGSKPPGRPQSVGPACSRCWSTAPHLALSPAPEPARHWQPAY